MALPPPTSGCTVRPRSGWVWVALVCFLATPAFSADELQIWEDKVKEAAPNFKWKVGEKAGEEYIRLIFDTGWKPPENVYAGKVDVELTLWKEPEKARQSLGQEKAKLGKLAKTFDGLGPGIEALVGADLTEVVDLKKWVKEKKVSPTAKVKAVLSCGSIVARFTASGRGAFKVPIETPDLSLWSADQKKMAGPDFLKTARQAKAVLATALRQVGAIFADKSLCGAPTEAVATNAYLERLRAVMEKAGMAGPRVARHDGTAALVWEDGPDAPYATGIMTRIVVAPRADEEAARAAYEDLVKQTPCKGGKPCDPADMGDQLTGRKRKIYEEWPGKPSRPRHLYVLAEGRAAGIGICHDVVVEGARVHRAIETIRLISRWKKKQPPDEYLRRRAGWRSNTLSLEAQTALSNRLSTLRKLIDEEVVDCEKPAPSKPERLNVAVLDANPKFTPGGKAVHAMSLAERVNYDEQRRGLAADGVSRVLLRIPVGEQAKVTLRLDPPSMEGQETGRLFRLAELKESDGVPGGNEPRQQITVDTETRGESHYAFAVYLPPRSFGWSYNSRLDGLAAREIALTISVQGKVKRRGGKAYAASLLLVPPPVVLVHGTFSTTDKWTDVAAPPYGGQSMAEVLEDAGFKVFLADFSRTNGRLRNPDLARTGIEGNRLVVWDPTGHGKIEKNHQGIKGALDFYRADLGLAATQADVVAHSLGGLLARVLASSAYHSDGKYLFTRRENFSAGDIHRLITLCTPHFGSDLPWLAQRMHDLQADDQPIKDVMDGVLRKVARAALLVGWSFIHGGGVVADQRPESEALKKIGPTAIPAHAIGCLAGTADLRAEVIADTKRNTAHSAKNNADYQNMYESLGYFFAKSSAYLAAFKPEIENPAQKLGKNRYERLLEIIELIDFDAWEADGRIAIMAGTLAKFLDEIKPEYDSANVKNLLHQQLRAAIFGNTPNDAIVRLESQLGGLEAPFYTEISGVQHGFAPLYASVQAVVRELLTGPQSAFAPAGFPAAGKPMADLQPGLLAQPPAERLKAIWDSNIVPSHAKAIMAVAQGKWPPPLTNPRGEFGPTIIIVRPVNRFSTELIREGAATKAMHVKGKSSNWGPHRGFIAVDQSYSKLAKLAPKDGPKYNCAVVDSLKRDPAAATRRTLEVQRVDGAYKVYRVPGKKDKDGLPLVVLGREGSYFDLRDPPVKRGDVKAKDALPLEVLTTPDEKKLFLTADYDLHSVGTLFADPPPQGEENMDPERGFITKYQLALVTAINESVARFSRYEGGNVVHHGPENQFTLSPGNDYPVTAFVPGPHGGWIESIKEGPKGKTDLHLKRFIFRKKKLRNWYLEPNPTWNWGKLGADGYREEDQPNLQDDPKNSDDNDGEEKKARACPPLPPCGGPSAHEPSAFELPPDVDPAGIGCG